MASSRHRGYRRTLELRGLLAKDINGCSNGIINIFKGDYSIKLPALGFDFQGVAC